ncbi:hypothetical protein SDRG_12189 [Saprolegnia diclina VS20]|uniref:AttH domain-containing protein n=1 Tax=Saprolegnia diclina (strain VS20) TaxID=1156394 RepID=T0Q696_SAPDV|nr:hypothetical protein SDRG_12189 [Saprolegnia diclina VS20]EQC30131.1 hypothetical protein SDRG_12189 [Saprolegnia diclina VS20]|eukprot:XP_008616474.1 hypothetical protein SDRG_12189 [Saprolegnia diclina VS20]
MHKQVVSAACTLLLALLLWPRSAPYAKTTTLHFPAHAPLAAAPPMAAYAGGRYTFGRWKHAIADVGFHSHDPASDVLDALTSSFQTKLWHYTSVDTPRFFLGFAFVQLQYVSDVFLYLVDKASMEKHEYTARRPGTVGLAFAASSIDAHQCTVFSASTVLETNETIEACYVGGAWQLRANVPLTSANGSTTRLDMEMALQRDEALTLLYPLADDPRRPAYVHKGAGSAATGHLQFGASHMPLTRGLGAIDWTKSMALRETTWHWASASFFDDDGTAIGINLSQHVYDVDGASQENAIWVDGRVCALRGVQFQIPDLDPVKSNWRITSIAPTSQDNVTLVFTPAGARRDDAGVPYLLHSRFVQPYGTFSGRIVCATDDNIVHDITVDSAFGVVEDHFALW